MLWGPVGDRFGRVRTLMFTILCYSVFTFAGALAPNVWQLASSACWQASVSAASGRWAEPSSPRSGRRTAAKWARACMQTGYYFGVLVAGVLNATVGAQYGWRAMFAVGGMPAFLVVLIQLRRARAGSLEAARIRPPRHGDAVLAASTGAEPFSMRSTCSCRSADCGQARSTFLRRSHFWRAREGLDAVETTRLASYATILLSVGHHPRMPGVAAAWPNVTDAAGPWRSTFFLMFVSIALGFGYAYYLQSRALEWFLASLVVSGLWRRELHHVLAVAAGAVSHRMPRQRLRIRHLGGPFPGGRQSLFWKAGGGADAYHRHSRRADVAVLPVRASSCYLGEWKPKDRSCPD